MRSDFSCHITPQNLDDFYALFEPFLPCWAECAALKANEQVDLILNTKHFPILTESNLNERYKEPWNLSEKCT